MKPTVRTSGSLAALVAAVLVLLVDPATAKWSDPVRVSGVRDVHREPLVAVDREGDVAIGWTRYDKSMSAGDQEARVEARLRMRINGDWRRGRRVSTLGSQAVVQDVALDDDGDGWVMYTEDYRMYLRRISAVGGLAIAWSWEPERTGVRSWIAPATRWFPGPSGTPTTLPTHATCTGTDRCRRWRP